MLSKVIGISLFLLVVSKLNNATQLFDELRNGFHIHRPWNRPRESINGYLSRRLPSYDFRPYLEFINNIHGTNYHKSKSESNEKSGEDFVWTNSKTFTTMKINNQKSNATEILTSKIGDDTSLYSDTTKTSISDTTLNLTTLNTVGKTALFPMLKSNSVGNEQLQTPEKQLNFTSSDNYPTSHSESTSNEFSSSFVSSLSTTNTVAQETTEFSKSNSELDDKSNPNQMTTPPSVSDDVSSETSSLSLSSHIISTVPTLNTSSNITDETESGTLSPEGNLTTKERTPENSTNIRDIKSTENVTLTTTTYSSRISAVSNSDLDKTNSSSSHTQSIFPDERQITSTEKMPISETESTLTLNTTSSIKSSHSSISHTTNQNGTNVGISSTLDSIKSEVTNEGLISQTVFVYPEHINISSIKIAKIAISSVFLAIAVIIVASLAIYIFMVKRRAVQYDQLRLLP